MNEKYLAVDQGTSATKAMLFDRQGAILGSARQAYEVENKGRGYIEQDPEELFDAALQTAREAMRDCTPEQVVTLGLSVQTGAFLLWDKSTGQAVTPVIAWQCRRGQVYLDSLSDKEKKEFERIVSAKPEPDGVPEKLAQIFRENQELIKLAEEKRLLFGTMETWLIWRLTKGRTYKSDVTNACITRLYLENEGRWNQEALAFLGIPVDIFPQVVDNNDDFGEACISGLEGIRIHGSMGDSAAAMFGEGCWKQGQSKITYGTGASYLVHLGNQKEWNALPDTFLGWKVDGTCHYVWEGTLPHVGSSIQWIERLGIIQSAKETEALAESLADNGGVYFLPQVQIAGREQNLLLGMDFFANRAHIARAVLESIGFRIWEMQQLLLDAGIKMDEEIRADGGMSVNRFLMQFQADLLQQQVICNQHPDISAYGAFLMAAYGAGSITLKEILAIEHQNKVYQPGMNETDRQSLLKEWKKIRKETQ